MNSEPKPPRPWAIFGLCVWAACLLVMGYMLGLYHQMQRSDARLAEIRELMIEPPLKGLPPRRVIPELGLKLYWLDWNNGPIHKLMVEDIRTY